MNKKNKVSWLAYSVLAVAMALSLGLVGSVQGEGNEGPTGSITVCKVILDANGEVVTGEFGTTFEISWLTETEYISNGGTGEDDEVAVPDTVSFDTPLVWNEEVDLSDLEIQSDGNNAECVDVELEGDEDLPPGRYYYDQEEIDSDDDWETPLYDDGFDDSGFDEYSYSPSSSADNWDGVINVGEDGHRTLIVVNQMVAKETATIHATKVVCDAESKLPNWGDQQGDQAIDEDTAQDWVDDHPGCKLAEWDFEWAYSSETDNPGDAGDNEGSQGSGWTAFVNGVAEINPEEVGNVMVRELWNDDYIPFAGDTGTNQTPSAELYCYNDNFKYDNLEILSNLQAGEDYYCVGWNVPLDEPEEEFCPEPSTLGDDNEVDFGESDEDTLQEILDAEYGGGAPDTVNDETNIQVWNVPGGTDSVKFTAKFIESIAGNTNTLGYYVNGDLSTFTTVTYDVETVVDATGVTSIGFAIRTVNGGTNDYGTEMSENPGNVDQAVVYNLGGGKYVVAFEDLVTNSDRDFNDLVVEIMLDCEEEQSEDTATIHVTKIVCPTENLLPNWGDGEPVDEITSTTDEEFLAANPSCSRAEWTFEWAPSGTPNPGDNLGDTSWTDFTGSVNVPAGALVWVREQLKDGYILFSGDTNGGNGWNDVSAELYCNGDVLNYDNYDWISPVEAGADYYCIGFNVPDETDEGGGGSQNDEQEERHITGSGSSGGGGGGSVLGAQTEICSWTTTYMRRGWRGNIPAEVMKVQSDLLNGHMNSGLVVDGIFGPLTEGAVKAFQQKYAADVLTPWGITAPTGIFYLSSLHKAQELLCPTNEAPLPTLINWSQNPAVSN